MMAQTVFILEDDGDIASLMRRTLEEHGFGTERYARRADFVRAVERSQPALCLVDLSLPDGDGLSVVGAVLQRLNVPAIIVTGRGDLADRVAGLEIGADDYMVKPFEPRELIARVRAVLRRSSPSASDASARHRVRFDEWIADFDACTVQHREGEEIALSYAEAKLLRAFVEANGRVLSRSVLLDLKGAEDLEPFDRSIDIRISRLRKKLDDDSRNPHIIKTVYGAGYVFAPKIQWLE